MNEKLQQAIVASRSGKIKEAQLLLTQVLRDDPDETQAWFLLSHLVDSDAKKKAYLSKVLALDPDHAKARETLLRLQGRTPVSEPEPEIELEPSPAPDTPPAPQPEAPPSPTTADDEAELDDAGFEAFLDEMMAAEEDGVETEAADEVETAVPQPVIDEAEGEELPDWLLEVEEETAAPETAETDDLAVALAEAEAADEESETETAVVPPKTEPEKVVTSSPEPEKITTSKPQQLEDDQLQRILMILIILAVFVAIVLIYLLIVTL